MLDLPPLTMHLLDLFQGPLRDVRFPDADADRLGAAIDAAATAKAAVAQAEATLVAAKTALADRQRVVTQETERALAYARIYAADRPDVRAAIEAAPTHTPARRGPGRPRKKIVTPAVDEAAE